MFLIAWECVRHPSEPKLPMTDTITLRDVPQAAERSGVSRAAVTHRERGSVVLRGLLKAHTPASHRDTIPPVNDTPALLPQPTTVEDGWLTPDGAPSIPASERLRRDQRSATQGRAGRPPRGSTRFSS